MLPLQTNGQLSASEVDMRHAWVTDGSRLFRTADGGVHWALIKPHVPAASRDLWSGQAKFPEIQIDFVSRTIGFAIKQMTPARQPAFLLETTDGGYNWRIVYPRVAGLPQLSR